MLSNMILTEREGACIKGGIFFMENTGKDEEMILSFRESRIKCGDFAVRRSRDVAFTSHKDHSKPKQHARSAADADDAE